MPAGSPTPPSPLPNSCLPQFYAPWCGHCKALKPAWIDLARQLGGKVRVGAVDCTSDKATCDEFGVRGEPASGAKLCSGLACWGAEMIEEAACRVHGARQEDDCRPLGAAEGKRPLPYSAQRHLLLLLRSSRAGFPTIKWFGEHKSSPQDYDGSRDVSALAAFATERWASQQPPPEVRTGGIHNSGILDRGRTGPPPRLALVVRAPL
jgi:thiol-disulfide isomerase/thioredoxin